MAGDSHACGSREQEVKASGRGNAKFAIPTGGAPVRVPGCKQQEWPLAASGRKGVDWTVTGRSQRRKEG